MVLGQLEDEAGPLRSTVDENELKIKQRPKCKNENYKTPAEVVPLQGPTTWGRFSGPAHITVANLSWSALTANTSLLKETSYVSVTVVQPGIH